MKEMCGCTLSGALSSSLGAQAPRVAQAGLRKLPPGFAEAGVRMLRLVSPPTLRQGSHELKTQRCRGALWYTPGFGPVAFPHKWLFKF